MKETVSITEFTPNSFREFYLSCDAIPAEYRTDVLADRCTGIAGKLLENNEKFNLTTITAPDEVLYKHILDSLLSALTVRELTEGIAAPRLLDIGSGAGFPALPIAAAEPTVRVIAVDATAKKCAHMNETADAIGIANFSAISARAEELASGALHREAYDIVTARAVANLPVLAELCLPFVKIGGYFVAMKGTSAPEELEAARAGIGKLGGKCADLRLYALPGDPNPRYFLIIQKISPTPAAYPRQFAKIKKNPLH